MSDEVLVKVENVSKKFCRSLKKSLWYGVQDIATELTGTKKERELRPDEFWAVKDVSFEVKRGECLALIGPNGAGKSTLLKMLNNLIKPDKGYIRMRGRVGALIELGAGFNPILTGRENIYVNGAVLGLSKVEIDRKFDEIIEFAEIGDFLDTPVQNYSSGMKVRLGFAVAAHINPDILLIDEILAVGDAGFRGKCYNAIGKLQKRSAIIFISHTMPAVGRICNRTLVINKGQEYYQGMTPQGIQSYNQLFNFNDAKLTSNNASLINIKLLDCYENQTCRITYGSGSIVELDLELHRNIEKPIVNLHFMDITEQYAFQTNSFLDKQNFNTLKKGRYTIRINISDLNLNPGRYSCSLVVFNSEQTEFLLWAHNILPFEVVGDFIGACFYLGHSQWLLKEK